MRVILEERPLAHHLNFLYLKIIIVPQDVFEVTKFHSPKLETKQSHGTKNNIFQ